MTRQPIDTERVVCCYGFNHCYSAFLRIGRCWTSCICADYFRHFRWVCADGAETRNKRLTMLGWIAFVILAIVCIDIYIGSHANSVTTLIQHFRFDLGALIFIVLVAAGSVPFLLVLICVIKGISIIFKGVQGKDRTDRQSPLSKILKTPVVAATVAVGIVSIFFIIPFLISETKSGGPLKIWVDGVTEINSLLSVAESDTPVSVAKPASQGIEQAIICYVLIYVIVLGAGTAAVKLLFGLICRTFKYDENQNKLYDEYSSPVAILIVGVAFLLALIEIDDFTSKGPWKTLGIFVQYLVMVVVLAAIVVLVVELTRRVINITDKLIREEAGYLGIALYAQVFLLLLGLITAICSALNSAVGSAENTRMDEIESKLKQRMVEAANRAIEGIDKEQKKAGQTFPPFKGKSTKK